MGFRRVLAATATAMALLVVAASPADARQVVIDRWDLTAAGSAHTVLTANNLVVWRQSCNGCGVYVVDHWLPWYCTVGSILPGNAAGTPLRIRLVPPIGSGLACLPNAYDPLYGWATGTGHAEGQNFWAGWCVGETVYQIPFRNPNYLDSYGTELTVC